MIYEVIYAFVQCLSKGCLMERHNVAFAVCRKPQLRLFTYFKQSQVIVPLQNVYDKQCQKLKTPLLNLNL